MRIVVIVILVIVAIWIFIAGLRNKRRISGIAIFVLLAPAIVLGYFEFKWQEIQNTITIAVQEVSGVEDASFECQRLSLAFFDVWVAEKTTTVTGTKVGLKYSECKEIFSWLESEDKNKITLTQVEAMQLLTQETMRVSGIEAVADQKCLGIRNISAMVQYLGGTEAQGTYFYRYYKQEIGAKDSDTKSRNC